jgi:hypothetical protein
VPHAGAVDPQLGRGAEVLPTPESHVHVSISPLFLSQPQMEVLPGLFTTAATTSIGVDGAACCLL